MKWMKMAVRDGWNNKNFLLAGWVGMTVVTGYLMLYQDRIFRTFWKTEACRMDFLLFLPVLCHYGFPFLLPAVGSYGRYCFQEHRILRFSSERVWWSHSLFVAVSGILVCTLAAGICALIPVWVTHSHIVNWNSQTNLMIFYTNAGKDMDGQLALTMVAVVFGFCLSVCSIAIVVMTIQWLCNSALYGFIGGIVFLWGDFFFEEHAVLFPKAEEYYKAVQNGTLGHILFLQMAAFGLAVCVSVWLGGRKECMGRDKNE